MDVFLEFHPHVPDVAVRHAGEAADAARDRDQFAWSAV
jgi:hypothetical protein